MCLYICSAGLLWDSRPNARSNLSSTDFDSSTDIHSPADIHPSADIHSSADDTQQRAKDRFATATSTSRPQGGTVVVGGLTDPITLDPLLAVDETSLAIAGLLLYSLLAVDPWTGGLVPNLARAWRVLADGLTITFDLRDDVLWHDGEPFTAEDVHFTFEAIANTSTGLSTGLGVDSPHRFDLTLV